MNTPQELRRRALNIRETALGFSDKASRTMIELAEALEAEAAAIEAMAGPKKPRNVTGTERIKGGVRVRPIADGG